MNIAIDLRSLSSGTISGVENYCLNLLNNLLPLDRANHYTLFYNAFGRTAPGEFHFVNSTEKNSRLPNRLVNLALKFNLMKMEKLTGEVDCLFLPNLNQFNANPKTKVVITVHDLSPVVTPEFYDVKRRLWHKFLNYIKAFQRADLLLAVSESTKQDLIRLFNIADSKIRVIYPGVDASAYSHELAHDKSRAIRNKYGLPGEFILFLNTIEPRKNLATLVKAFEQLQGPTNLVIAGRLGWKYGKDFRLIKNSRKSNKVKYLGYVEEADKGGLIKLAKALVYPSFYEGFGFQPLEAMAVGTPVIASQLTSLPEVVGDAGLLVNPYDVNSLVSTIKQILSNEALRENLIKKANERVKLFSWKRTAEQTLEALNNLR